jgi:hypothetical protein
MNPTFLKISTVSSQKFLILARYPLLMKNFTARSLLVLGIVATLGLTTPILASAGSNAGVGSTSNKNSGSNANKTYREQVAAYNASRQAIENGFHLAVSTARVTLYTALATANSSAQRSADRQAMQAAIIQAAAARSAALTTLGSRPVKTSQ